MFVEDWRSGSPLTSQAGFADVQAGSGGARTLPEESHPCRISGHARVGTPLENDADPNPALIVYVSGPIRHSSESVAAVKLNAVITVDHAPPLNRTARLAHDVPSPAPAAVTLKWRVTRAIAYPSPGR